MIAILLIAIAAGCASALMFASIISGALISLLLFYLAPLPLMVAATGMGTAQRHHRRHRRRHRPRRDLRPSLLHRLCRHGRAARLVARPSRPAGPAHANGVARPTAPRPPRRPGMVSGRPHPALDRGLCLLTTMAALLTLGTDAATITERACGAACADPRTARRSLVRRNRTMARCSGDRSRRPPPPSSP